MTDDLIAWLRAQLDDDERVARATTERQPYDEWDAVGAQGDDDAALSRWGVTKIAAAEPTPAAKSIAQHIARHDPARVLRQVERDRRILDEHSPSGDECRTCCGEPYLEETWDGEEERTTWKRTDKPWPCPTIRLLALPYADRPGYRPEWAPTA